MQFRWLRCQLRSRMLQALFPFCSSDLNHLKGSQLVLRILDQSSLTLFAYFLQHPLERVKKMLRVEREAFVCMERRHSCSSGVCSAAVSGFWGDGETEEER